MKTILETERLILRTFSEQDAENFYSLNSNPNVIRYTGNQPFGSIEEARLFLKNYSDYKRKGYGRWSVIEKSSGQFLGWCGLKFNAEDQETDIGFRFFEHFWNKGFATESAFACLNYGFAELNLKRIIGRAMKENKASIKVLEKIGLRFEKEILFEGEDAVIYSIER